MRAWVVRGGGKGRYEEAALSGGLVVIVWEEIPDLAPFSDAEAIRRLVEQAYVGKSSYVIGNWTGQLWRFRGEMAVGDLVVLPRVGHRLAIGRITGDYECRTVGELQDAHVRNVEWLRTDVPRADAQPDLRDSLGSLMTVYELRRNNAADRIKELSEGRLDPGRPSAEANALSFASTQDLLEAAAARENGDPIVLPVRKLLGLWGAHRRGSVVVEQIQRDLAETGLTTKPPFNDGDINSSVAIVPLDVDPEEVEPEAVASETPLPPISYLVGNLPSATSKVISAKAAEPLAEAINRMSEHGYSQLPVLSVDEVLMGALTWQSIAVAMKSGEKPERVVDALTFAPFARSADSLLSKVQEIFDYGYVFVLDGGGRVAGIVTSADLASQFADRVQPFILVEEVEQRLRRIIDTALNDQRLGLPRVREILGDKQERIQAAKDLTLGQYRPLLQQLDVWEGLKLDTRHDLFLKWVFEVKEFRNNLMHFSPDPLTPGDLVTVQGFLNLLKALDPAV